MQTLEAVLAIALLLVIGFLLGLVHEQRLAAKKGRFPP